MKKLLKIFWKITISVITATVIINIAVVGFASFYIKEQEALSGNFDCIIVLGTSVKANSPGDMLKDKLDKAIEIYKSGKAKYIVMSGDGIDKYYNETKIMVNYALEKGVDADKIYIDEAGLSTYESIYRAKKVLNCKNPIIVTQKYHLYRAEFIAKCLGLKAVGVAADGNNCGNMAIKHLREYFARIKDFFFVFLRPSPSYGFEKKIYFAEVK